MSILLVGLVINHSLNGSASPTGKHSTGRTNAERQRAPLIFDSNYLTFI